MISLDQPAGASTSPKMQYIPPHQQLTGQCPECGWTPPPQNQFRPNNFNEYMDDKGRISVLSETDPVVEIRTEDGVLVKTYRKYRDSNGRVLIDPTTKTSLSAAEIEAQTVRPVNPGLVSSHRDAPPAQLKVSSEAVKPTPTSPIPASVLIGTAKQPPVKTAEEIAATPRITPESIKPNLPTPALSQGLPVDAPLQPNKPL